MQTKFGDGKGDCFAACVASILEVPLGNLPNFCVDFPSDTWFADSNEWLLRYCGVGLHDFRCEEPFPWISLYGEFGPYYIVSGTSPRGLMHACVGRDGKVVHDPHPDGGGLLDIDSYTVFVAMQPERWRDAFRTDGQ